MGSSATLLWPDDSVMAEFSAMTINYSSPDLIHPDNSYNDLLWPARLINEQARLSQHRNFSIQIAIAALILSLILGFVVGPAQLILIATILDYNWVSASYLPTAMHYCLILSSLACLFCIISLILSLRAKPKTAVITIYIVCSTLAELTLLWLAGCVISLEPHQFTLIYLIIFILSILVLLFLNKQYFHNHHLTTPFKIVIAAFILLSILETSFTGAYLIDYAKQVDPDRLAQLSNEQLAARVDGVPTMLSDFTHQLCNSKYSVIYLSSTTPSGLFECVKNHDVYSVEDLGIRNANSIRAAATYLGTTLNPEVSAAFPNSHYLYRSMPNTLNEDELALMVPAHNEEELVGLITPQILAYWQSHSARDLHLSVFYNDDIASVATTKDFILMSALETMALIDKLPSGNTRHGYLDDKIIAYIYQPDHKLNALNELGANPSLYPISSRYALTTHRHISIRLKAHENLDEDALRTKLTGSFTGGLE